MQKEVLMNEVKELLGLKECKIKIINVSERLIKKKKIKVITIIGMVKKVKCPICEKYTYNIHERIINLTRDTILPIGIINYSSYVENTSFILEIATPRIIRTAIELITLPISFLGYTKY